MYAIRSYYAMDLFAQAEHDEDAQSVLISLDADFTQRVLKAITELLEGMERRDIIKASLERHGALITARTTDQAIDLINRLAPSYNFV